MKYFYRAGLFLGLLVQGLTQPTAAVAAPFTPGNIVIARVGEGGTVALSSASAAVFLDEYTPAGVLVQSVPMPTAVLGNNRALTVSGSSTAELSLARTANGQALVLAGYGAVPGIAAIPGTSAADYVRVVGLVGADGTVNTTTSLGSAFNGTSTNSSAARSVASADGTSFYVVGSGSPSNVQYITLGGFSPTAITSASIATRAVRIFNGNLYLSTGSSPYNGLSQIGTGLPTTAGQAVTALPGFGGATTATDSPYGFYFADLSTTVPGVDVAYVADDRGATGGIQKWSLVGGTWTLNGTIASSATAQVRGLDGNTTGTVVSLVATSPTGLYIIGDASGYNVAPTLATLPAAVATSATNTAFRGVAFAPVGRVVSATLAGNALPGLTVFPNPATGYLTVELPTSAPATVALRDLTGRLVLAPAALNANHQLLLPASLASGVYLLEVRQGATLAIRRVEKK